MLIYSPHGILRYAPFDSPSAAQRRLIIITAPASIMKVRARARVRARVCVRILCWCRESARVRRLVAFGHRRRTGSDEKNERRREGRDGGGYNEGGFEAYTPCLGSAESRTKEKRVRSLRDERRVPNDHGKLRAGIFIFSMCADPGGTRARFPKDGTF